MRDREEPLDERQPAIQSLLCVRVRKVERDGLALVGRGIPIVHQGEVGDDPVLEPKELEVPVEPPARVLLPEHDHQQRRDKQHAPAPDCDLRATVDAVPTSAERPQDDQDGDRDDDPEAGGQPIEIAIRVLHRELHRITGVACHLRV